MRFFFFFPCVMIMGIETLKCLRSFSLCEHILKSNFLKRWKDTSETQIILTFLLLKYSPTKWPINTIYRTASSDACWDTGETHLHKENTVHRCRRTRWISAVWTNFPILFVRRSRSRRPGTFSSHFPEGQTCKPPNVSAWTKTWGI